MAAVPGRSGSDRITGEHAALRRVATLVAGAAPPEEVFAAVTEEAGRLLSASYTTMARYDPDGARTVVAAWSSTGPAYPVGTRTRLGGQNVSTLVFQTGRPARIDDHADASGPAADDARRFGLRAVAGVPVCVEGRLWGVMYVGSTRQEPLPAGIEGQLAEFTELAATAIANCQARMELQGFAEEQAALRRVAMLIAQGVPPEEVFAAVAAEAGRVLGTDFTFLSRYGPDNAAIIVGAWTRTGTSLVFPVGSRWNLSGRNLHTLLFQTHQPARINDYAGASGPVAEAARESGLRASVGVPISVAGGLWGVMIVGSRAEPLPASIEGRLAGFAELAATAIANAQACVELRGFADEQAALRRVAMLVARPTAPEDVFAAVTEEAGRLLGADYITMARYDPDGARTIVASWSSIGAGYPVGNRARLGGWNVQTLVFQTGRPARIDDYAGASGPLAEAAREFGFRAAAGAPVRVEGRLWGVMYMGSTRQEPLPAGTEARLGRFTELAGTAIANAEAQAALTASRARIVATADATRRRIEHNLHDGAQQRLVSLTLDARAAQAAAPPGTSEQFDHLAAGMDGVLDDLREIARGLHPAILADGGLPPALKTLARRSAIPVRLDTQVDRRLPDPIETAAYYTVAEALTNIAKHALATTADIQATEDGDVLHLRVHDNGTGGATFSHGSGLVGLKDRAEALSGHLDLHSPPGEGTTLDITLPLHDHGGLGLPPAAADPAEDQPADRPTSS